MSLYYPEGWIIDTPQNRAAMANISTLTDACHEGQILEGRALICDSAHNLIVDLGCMKGIIPRVDSAIGIREGNVRDIAIISRVNRPVCFMIVGFQKNEDGRPGSNTVTQNGTRKMYGRVISALQPGDIVNTRVTHLENFGAFADIGCGIISLLPIDAISISY